MNVPESYDPSSKSPLVVYLHGFTGLPEEAFRTPTGLEPAIAANSRSRPSASRRSANHTASSWTAGRCYPSGVIRGRRSP